MVLHPSRFVGISAPRLGGGLLLVVTLLAGCGDDGDSPEALDIEADVDGCEPGEVSGGDQPEEAPAVPEDLAATFDEAIEATRALSSAQAIYEVDLAGGFGEQELDVEGDVEADGVSVVAGQVTGSGEEQTTVLCSDGETSWLHLDNQSVLDALPDGVSWVQAPNTDLSELGIVFDMQDMWEILPILRGVDAVEDQGTDDVNGVPVRMLRGEVDFQAAVEAASEEEAQGLTTAITVDDPEAQVDLEVALDGDNVVRSLEVSVDGEVPSMEEEQSTERLQMEIAMEIAMANPTIEAPTPPAEDGTVPLADVPDVESMLTG